jgi:excisionase family DNA binding protein
MSDAMTVITLREAADIFGIAYSTLAQAVREKRLPARKSGSTWLTTEDDVRTAIAYGKLMHRDDIVKYRANGLIHCPHHGNIEATYAAQDPAPCGCAWVWEDELLIAVPQ